MLSYNRLSKKPLLFKSFTGLTLQEFDDIYDKKITKRYHDYEIKRLSKRKNRKRSIGVGRPFKLGVKDRWMTQLLEIKSILLSYPITLSSLYLV